MITQDELYLLPQEELDAMFEGRNELEILRHPSSTLAWYRKMAVVESSTNIKGGYK